MRVILDTNTLVSALLVKQSIPRQAFDKAKQHGSVLLSNATLEELDSVLKREKFKKYITDAERILFLQALLSQSILLEIEPKITACRDPKDNKFLDLAVAGVVDYLVTGDDDLLVLNPLENTKILTPREFLEHTILL
jgi:putative PIN family toxin of toxin-antitoxin system